MKAAIEWVQLGAGWARGEALGWSCLWEVQGTVYDVGERSGQEMRVGVGGRKAIKEPWSGEGVGKKGERGLWDRTLGGCGVKVLSRRINKDSRRQSES